MSIDPPRPPSHPCRPFRAAPRRCAAVVLGAAALLAAAILPRAALAAPEAHILRIDPRAAMVDGAPVLTTVLELVQNKRYTAITGECGALPENDQLDCIADRLEQPQALYMPLAFPEKAALLTVTVEDVDMPATFVSRGRWGESKSADGVGTAWLLAIDAAASMGPRFPEAKAVARAFVDSMDPQDIVDVMFFNDRAIVSDSEWVSSKATAAAFIDGVPRPYLAQGRTRNLSKIIQTAATNAFRELGNVGSRVKVPMHQAMVLLSNGASGADPSSAAPAAEILKQYLTKGRFPEDNKTLPKAPVPVVSIWFPRRELEELYENARSFMENLANHEIGGFFSIVRDGQSARAPRIAKAVRTRFDQMHIVKWRVSCVAPSLNQTFKLLFRQTDPPIAGDMFENVPTGIDPTTWPLDIDVAATNAYTKKNPIYPGGTVKVFGNFCWGGNKSRAELYMIPKNQPAPQTLQGSSVEDAQKAQKQLIQSNMRGKAVEASDTYAEFEAPDSTKFLSGKGKKMTARLIVYDSRAHRASAITADKILTLPAEEKPLNLLLVGGITFGGVVLLLLVVQVFRSGDGKRRGAAAAAPPRPIVAGGAPPAASPFPAPAPAMPGPPLAGQGAPMPMAGFGAAPGMPQQATLSGPPGIYPVTAVKEVRVGRDPGQCDICLAEPRISAVHAVLRFEGGQLLVRDEGSNNGTFVGGVRIAPHTWTPVPNGSSVKFGPAEFAVRLE